MTQHNIAGSEAFNGRRTVIVTEMPRRAHWIRHPAVVLHAIAGGLGAAAGLVDHMTGGSVALVVVTIGFSTWAFWPARR